MEHLAVLGTSGIKYKNVVYVSSRVYVNTNIFTMSRTSELNVVLTFWFFLACKLGYTGANCDTKCFYPSYGKDCQSICICSEFFCDHENGCKNLTNGDFQNICKGYVIDLFSFTLNILQKNSICMHKYTYNGLYFISEEKTEELFVVMDTSWIKRRRGVNVGIVKVFDPIICF